MTFASDTYFKKGVNIHVFIGHMQRNFILTDIMKTGFHQDLENFISMHSMTDQTFDTVGQYYDLHLFDLDSYDRKFAILDYRVDMESMAQNPQFKEELQRRCDLLHSQGFAFIKATPWESLDNIKSKKQYPEIDIEHVKWTGNVSWFWHYMYNKHKDNTFDFTHDHNGSYWHKKRDFLYLNKAPRTHRVKLYKQLIENNVMDNSIHTFVEDKSKRRLDKEYELPGIDPMDYPRFGKDQDIYELPYIDTVCSIVSETNDNDYEVFMTEKIWKPIIAQHVFVVHGNYLYLQRLREMGFKTFGNYFDESYDLEQDSDKRINKIVSLCKELKSKCDDGSVVERGNKKWQDIYLQTQALRKHNYDTFFNKEKLSLEINKTLNLFLEFADSR
tara:strand:+ start:164 stop:1321 length:1158 start_codon:yes stop_codon:yes gene_type:complete